MTSAVGILLLLFTIVVGVVAFKFRDSFGSLNLEEAIKERDINRLIKMMDYLIASDEDSTAAREAVLEIINTEADLYGLVERVVLPAPYEPRTLAFLQDAFAQRVSGLDDENLRNCMNSTTGLFALRSLASTEIEKRKNG